MVLEISTTLMQSGEVFVSPENPWSHSAAVVTLVVVFVLFGVSLWITLENSLNEPRYKIFSKISIALVISMILIVLFMRSTSIDVNNEAAAKSNKNISEIVKNKYGITINEEVYRAKYAWDTPSAFIRNLGSFNATLNDGSSKGVILEISEDNNDVIVKNIPLVVSEELPLLPLPSTPGVEVSAE